MKSPDKRGPNLSVIKSCTWNMEGLRLTTELYCLRVFLVHGTTAGYYNMDERDFLPGTGFSLSKISKQNLAGEGIAEVVKILKIYQIYRVA